MCNVKMVSHPKNATVHKHLDARSYKGCIVIGSSPVLTSKIYIMKDTLLTVLSTVLSVAVTGIGLFLIINFLSGDFKIIPFIIGIAGYFISIRPSIDEWEGRFKRWFKIKE